MKSLVVVVGPTAVGKTSLSIELAKHYHTEVISADSRQFYKEMAIGTAKPTKEEMGDVPHHFVDCRSIHEPYDVGQYEREVLGSLEALYKKHDLIILSGGSGLFVDAVCRGFDELPKPDAGVRDEVKRLYEGQGLVALQQELKAVDPEYYEYVDIQNPQRLMRALEVHRSTGKKFSSFRKGKTVARPFEVIKVGLNLERSLLYERIDHRMDLMIQDGLFEEAKSLEKHQHLNALQTVGYREIYGYFNGDYDKEEAVRLLKRNSRRYAKRQLTWFKRDESTAWFAPHAIDEVIAYTEDRIKSERSEAEK